MSDCTGLKGTASKNSKSPGLTGGEPSTLASSKVLTHRCAAHAALNLGRRLSRRFQILFSRAMPLNTTRPLYVLFRMAHPPRPLLSVPVQFHPTGRGAVLAETAHGRGGTTCGDHTDGITDVLRECEETLRALARQGRLTDAALSAFIRLAHSVKQEMERRRGSERRCEVRSTADRRAGRTQTPRSLAWFRPALPKM